MSVPMKFALAAVLTLSVHTVAFADNSLGRLFYMPEERRALEQHQFHEPQAEEASPKTITLSGRIIRSDGKTVTWTDGSFEKDVTTPPVTGSTPLKVGQSVELTTGEVHDRLKGGRIVVRSEP